MVTDDLRLQRVLEAFADPTRRAILAVLRDGPLPVGELAERLPVSRPAVSRHLRVLELAGLVEHNPSGTRNVFRLQAVGFEDARAYLSSFWDEALNNYLRAVEARQEYGNHAATPGSQQDRQDDHRPL